MVDVTDPCPCEGCTLNRLERAAGIHNAPGWGCTEQDRKDLLRGITNALALLAGVVLAGLTLYEVLR
jgi:hypothetical protein